MSLKDSTETVNRLWYLPDAPLSAVDIKSVPTESWIPGRNGSHRITGKEVEIASKILGIDGVDKVRVSNKQGM